MRLLICLIFLSIFKFKPINLTYTFFKKQIYFTHVLQKYTEQGQKYCISTH